ncbi:MAG: MFS transporter [Bifidobacteriaceae bacterium]|jgi:MFS family permease|nr:MFS transporter [Bifidobacteriaceae bacterium]
MAKGPREEVWAGAARRPNLAFAGLAVSGFATLFLIGGAGVYTASAMSEFGTEHLLGPTFMVESLTRCLVLPLAAKLGGRIGRRPLFLAALAGYLVATLACGLAPSGLAFMAGRALAGLTWGLFEGNSFALIADLFPADDATRRTAYLQSVGLVALLVAAPAAGLLADNWTWRWVFWAALPLLAGAWGLVFVAIPRLAPTTSAPIDGGGVAALAGVLIPLSVLLAWGGSALPWVSPGTAALIGAAAVCAALLVRAERRAADPIFPAYVLRHRSFMAVLALMGAFCAVSAAFNFLPAFAESILDLSPAAAGFLNTPSLVVGAVGASMVGRRLAARGQYRGSVLGWGFALVAASGMVFAFGAGTAVWFILAATAVAGLAQACAQVLPFTYPMVALRPDRVATGIAVTSFVGTLASAFGNGLFTAVANTGLSNVFRGPIVLALIGLAAALCFRERQARRA